MAEFVKPFDCKNEKHVMWLKHLGATMAKSLSGDKKINMAAAIDDNPLPGQPHSKKCDGLSICTFSTRYEVRQCGVK